MKVITLDSIVSVIRARRGYKKFLSEFINECKIVDAIPVPENATNGDVIMTLFNCMVIEVSNGKVYVEHIFFPFDEEWWYSPYRKEVEE